VFDKATAKVMVQFMQRSAHFEAPSTRNDFLASSSCRSVKDITIKAGGLFEVTLSLPTFISVRI
jgi:hypothetical protein